jgi:hypothetical protein
MHTSVPVARRALVALALTAVAALAAACVPATPGATTTTTTAAPGTIRAITGAELEWTVSREADSASFAPGQVNYWSAGQSDSTSATYSATNGNATVLKQNAAGTYVPIGSESSVSWANRNRNGAGTVVTTANGLRLGQKVRLSGGTGTVNTATGVATIQWTGTVSINFYGQYVPFWIVNPKLTVSAGGAAKLTATLGGFASSLDDPDVRTPLAPTANVVLAEIADAWRGGSVSTGFTSATKYLGTTVTTPADAPQVLRTTANTAYWGSWPQSFVNFQNATGLGTYWYTSGGAADAKKPQDPVSVKYTLGA